MSSEGMIKILDYSSVLPSGERTVQIADTQFKDGLMKTAEGLAWSPKIREVLGDMPKDPSKIIVVINAMGAGEYYGCNANYDWFAEDVLRKYHPTFVTHGKPFLHHINHDAAKSYGKVYESDYNDVMHRVELIVQYDKDLLDKKYVDKINNGDLVNVSMGCRVPFDICSKCSHIAKTPAEYCDCLKAPPSKRWHEDGSKAFAINTKPTFFDISIVTIPADPTARVLIKVANKKQFFVTDKTSIERAQEEFKITDKRSVKTADTKSIKTVEEPKVENGKPTVDFKPIVDELLKGFDRALGMDIPKDVLNDIGESSNDPISLLKGFLDNDCYLRPQETQRIILVSSGHGDLADKLDDHGILARSPFKPDLLEKMLGSMGMPGLMDRLPSPIRERRVLNPESVKTTTIRIMIGPMEKSSFEQTVPVSDAFRALSGEEVEAKHPGFLSAIGNALATYTALGSIASAFDALFGARMSEKFLNIPAGIPMIAGGVLGNIINGTSDMLNAPTQRMDFSSLLGQQKFSSVKTATMVDFGLKPLLALPMAYAASELISNRAKQYDMEEYQRTGKYEPGFLSNPSHNMLLTLPMVLKFAAAKKVVSNYIKTAESKLGMSFSEIFKKSESSVIKNLKSLLFNKS